MVLWFIETTQIRMTWRKLKGNSAILPRKTRKKEWKEKHSLLRESIKRNNPSLSFISFVFNLYSVVFWEGDFLTLSWDLSLNFSSFFPIEEKLFYLLFVEERFFRIQFWSWRLSHPAHISWTVFCSISRTEDTEQIRGSFELTFIKIQDRLFLKL